MELYRLRKGMGELKKEMNELNDVSKFIPNQRKRFQKIKKYSN